MRYVIGIDGGGTKTELAAADLSGNVFYGKTLSGSNAYAKTADDIKKTLSDLTAECIAAYGAPVAVCIGAAGAIGGYADSLLKDCLTSVTGCENVSVFNDAVISLYADFSDGAGVSLTAGTGSICVAGDGTGKVYRTGGWGHLFSDGGSAYDITRRALAAVTYAHDGMGETTLLLPAFCEKAGCDGYESLVDKIYREYADKAALASLASVVTDCAARGDAMAVRILNGAAESLFRLCSAAIRKAGIENKKFAVSFNGGVLKNCAPVRVSLTEKLKNEYGCVVKDARAAVYGAVEIALRRLV